MLDSAFSTGWKSQTNKSPDRNPVSHDFVISFYIHNKQKPRIIGIKNALQFYLSSNGCL